MRGRTGRGLVVSMFAASLICGCGRRQQTRVSADEVLLERQIAGLRAMVATGHDQWLVPEADLLVVVKESLVQSLVDAALPIEGTVSERFTVRLQSARVTLEDGLALVRLEGQAGLSGSLAKAAFAVVVLHADLDVVDIDPETETLRARARVVAFETRALKVLGREAPGGGLLAELGREQLDSLAPLLSSIEIPVGIEHQIELPSVGPAPVGIAARDLPIALEVAGVVALDHRLFVSIGVGLDGHQESSR